MNINLKQRYNFWKIPVATEYLKNCNNYKATTKILQKI